MKKCSMIGLIVLAMIAVASMAPSSAQTDPDGAPSVAITNSNFKATAPERDHLNEEWVEMANRGTEPQNMDGWTLSDAKNNVYTFHGFVLTPGSKVRVHTGKGSNSATDLYWSRTISVWNNDGDIATLKDSSGKVVSSHKEGKQAAKRE